MNLNGIRTEVSRRLGGLGSPLRTIVVAVGCLAAGIVLFWLFNRVFYYYLAKSYADEFADAYNLNRGFANALLWVSFAAIVGLAGLAFSFSKRKRYAGVAGLLTLITVHSIAIGMADRNFQTSGTADKCYVLTRDSIKILNRVGVDPETGRECRLLTPAIAEKIDLYKTGKRPTLITSTSQAFFSLVSGEPVVWHAIDKDGSIEMFDLMGYHPQTGAELVAVDRDLVATWKQQRDRVVKRIPSRVNLDKFKPFDPLTGAAQVWFWRSDTGEYEFYDGPGYHPGVGDPLKVISREVLADVKKSLEATAAARKASEEKAEAEARARAEKERLEAAARKAAEEKADAEARARAEKERLETTARAEEARKARDAEIAAANSRQQSGADCDRLASNPTDSRRAADGVPFDQLKAVADQAVEVCTRATQTFPNELRYLYQLGRATQFKDRKRAFEMFSSLVGRGYPSAFDNLGGMYLNDRRDMATATKLFAQGASLGDADSMVSLADMVDKGFHGQQTPYQTKWALLTKAAELNHAGAQRALAAENIKLANTQAEQENARKAAEIFGSIIGGMIRR